MRIIFATWAVAEYQGRILTEEGGVDRLVSFWEVREKRVLPQYVEFGRVRKER